MTEGTDWLYGIVNCSRHKRGQGDQHSRFFDDIRPRCGHVIPGYEGFLFRSIACFNIDDPILPLNGFRRSDRFRAELLELRKKPTQGVKCLCISSEGKLCFHDVSNTRVIVSTILAA